MKLCFPLMLKALLQHFLDQSRILPLFQETLLQSHLKGELVHGWYPSHVKWHDHTTADHSWVFGCFLGVLVGFWLFGLCLFVLFCFCWFWFCRFWFLFFFDECYKTQGIINKIWKNTGNKTEPVKSHWNQIQSSLMAVLLYIIIKCRFLWGDNFFYV